MSSPTLPTLDPSSPTSPLAEVLRAQLLEFLRGGSAHVDPRTALAAIDAKHYGAKPAGLPHTPWQLLEHLRLTLQDLIEFCTNEQYVAPAWPEDYWPDSEAPADSHAWQSAVRGFLGCLAAFEALIEAPSTDLAARIPWGDGQTILREALLAIDHTSYHLGQLVLVCKQLGDWQD